MRIHLHKQNLFHDITFQAWDKAAVLPVSYGFIGRQR